MKNKTKNQRFLTCQNSLSCLNKRGLSAVVAALLLVLLTIVLVGILWVVISNLVEGNLDKTQSCLDIFEKVTLGDAYTCYNDSSDELHFSINLKDIKVDGVLVSISGAGSRQSLTITNTLTQITNIRPYTGEYLEDVQLPEQNGGRTYVFNASATGVFWPDKIEIAPIINGNQCDVSDSILEIDRCT
ncbi:MAG: archaellin/type IV pilin N-terminal domain-containing protein [archaeon]